MTDFSRLDQDIKFSLIYNDNSISELSSEQAAELVSENGYFGVDQTAYNIANQCLVLSRYRFCLGTGFDIETSACTDGRSFC